MPHYRIVMSTYPNFRVTDAVFLKVCGLHLHVFVAIFTKGNTLVTSCLLPLTNNSKETGYREMGDKTLECTHLSSDFQVVWVIMNHKLLLIDMVV